MCDRTRKSKSENITITETLSIAPIVDKLGKNRLGSLEMIPNDALFRM